MIVYEGGATEGHWDGTSGGGKVLPAATYYYIIDLNNGKPTYTGPVTIVKKRN